MSDLWQQFVNNKSVQANVGSFDADLMPKISFSEVLEALIPDQIVTEDMLDKILVVTFSHGDIYYYYYGQCYCESFRDCQCDGDSKFLCAACKRCQCLGNANSALLQRISDLVSEPCVFSSHVMSADEMCFVTTLFSPNDLKDHIREFNKVPSEQVEDDQLVFEWD